MALSLVRPGVYAGSSRRTNRFYAQPRFTGLCSRLQPSPFGAGLLTPPWWLTGGLPVPSPEETCGRALCGVGDPRTTSVAEALSEAW